MTTESLLGAPGATPDLAVGLALGLVLGLYLFLKGLGDQTLRLDEARTALAVGHGRPYPWVPEERRCLYDSGNLDRGGLPLLHTWGQFYLAELGWFLARLVGPGRLSGANHPAGWLRLPFALAGWGAAWSMAVFCGGLAGPRAGLMALLVALTSPGLLLHSRQCRYYGPSMLTAGLFLVALARAHLGGGMAWWALAGLALAGSYHFDWVSSYGLGLAAAVAGLAYREAGVALTLGLAVALALPWIIFLKRRIGRTSSVPIIQNLRAGRIGPREIVILGAHTFWIYLWKIQAYAAPFLTVGLGGLATGLAALATGPVPADLGYGLALAALVIGGVAFTRSVTRLVFTRYVSAAFPAAVALAAFGLDLIWRASPVAGWCVLALTLFTNGPALLPHFLLRTLAAVRVPARLVAFVKGPVGLFTANLSAGAFARLKARPEFTLPRYLASLHRRYPTRTETVAAYLREAVHDGAVDPAGLILADTQEAPALALHSGLRVESLRGGPGAGVDEALGAADVVVGGGLFPPDGRKEFLARRARGEFQEVVVLAEAPDRYLDNAETPERYRYGFRPWPAGVALYYRGRRGQERGQERGRGGGRP